MDRSIFSTFTLTPFFLNKKLNYFPRMTSRAFQSTPSVILIINNCCSSFIDNEAKAQNNFNTGSIAKTFKKDCVRGRRDGLTKSWLSISVQLHFSIQPFPSTFCFNRFLFFAFLAFFKLLSSSRGNGAPAFFTVNAFALKVPKPENEIQRRK